MKKKIKTQHTKAYEIQHKKVVKMENACIKKNILINKIPTSHNIEKEETEVKVGRRN